MIQDRLLLGPLIDTFDQGAFYINTGCLAQLGERRPYKANVGGSIPSAPTIDGFGAVVQLVRMLACHAGGRGFESRPVRHSSIINH